jgi:hypothetical protein
VLGLEGLNILMVEKIKKKGTNRNICSLSENIPQCLFYAFIMLLILLNTHTHTHKQTKNTSVRYSRPGKPIDHAGAGLSLNM